jgi:phosphate transport system protein
MPRDTFDRELRRIQEEVLVLGGMVEHALVDSVAGLKARDMEASRRLIAQDRQINMKRFELENDALILIATQQPMAGDLRVLAAVLEITTELERIGDYAKGIARINVMIGDEPFIKPLIDIPIMARKASAMLDDALRAFISQDVALAKSVPPQDEEVDDLYNQVYRELMTYVVANPSCIDQANYLLWAAHNLERAADRVTNICERVVFTVTGRMSEMDSDQGFEGV